MDRQQVQSSSLVSVGYDSGENKLEIEFNNGRVYQYSSVPAAIYSELMDAPSKGAYFNYNIKDKYQYTEIK